MGGATHICSDKTGTLTLNKMTVMGLMAAEKVIEAGATVSDEMMNTSKNTFKNISSSGQSLWDTLIEGILWNSSAQIMKNKETDEYFTTGNVTE